MTRGGIIRGAVIGLAGMAAAKAASDAAAKAVASDSGQASGVVGAIAAAGAYNHLQMVLTSVIGRRVRAALDDANVQAIMAAIGWAEGTEGQRNPYAVPYGYGWSITNFSDHPARLGWRGVPLDKLGAAYVGKVSTAAGRYQINAPTWADAVRALGLRDFSPASQDAACVWLLDRCGALDLVKAGRISAALQRMAGTWASIPGGAAGQAKRRTDDIVAQYRQAGGVLA